MHYDIREILQYYDSDLRVYDYDQLIEIGVSRNNAEFMVSVGVPEDYDDFVFYGTDAIQKMLIDGTVFIKIGHYACYGILGSNGLYIKEGEDELFTSSSYRKPQIYMLNKNLKTFFWFHLIKNELAMEMKREGGYTTQKYAQELHRLYEQLDPLAMKDAEGYWSHLIEDYATGL
ncbi:hypothetical protein [Paenibacillus hubeiensis]|uniref:hypothetical protein n=1 Tax=Paenibacillus hubeiensis TaxID=3077330 RepID=UPI0031BAB9B7